MRSCTIPGNPSIVYYTSGELSRLLPESFDELSSCYRDKLRVLAADPQVREELECAISKASSIAVLDAHGSAGLAGWKYQRDDLWTFCRPRVQGWIDMVDRPGQVALVFCCNPNGYHIRSQYAIVAYPDGLFSRSHYFSGKTCTRLHRGLQLT